MNLYQFINESENLNVIVKLIRNNMMTSDVIQHIVLYDKFYQLEGKKGDRYKILAEEYGKHPDSISKIIRTLNKRAK